MKHKEHFYDNEYAEKSKCIITLKESSNNTLPLGYILNEEESMRYSYLSIKRHLNTLIFILPLLLHVFSCDLYNF